ncbi:homeobox protein ceh-63-like [Melitaea cinxia]|uniref:homeobox protein ceh-63-like n=1 Tax=Melitaea cinxia TaxID=113334 RepID=UPI001E2731CE|nr:homeobox protein ceh-63-like [Melitaea cinxia]
MVQTDHRSKLNHWENQPFSKEYPNTNQCELIEGLSVVKPINRKKKRCRTAYTTYQLSVLETTFTRTRYIDRKQRMELSNNLKIGEYNIKIWFQNRRMKEKKSSEICQPNNSTVEPVNPSPKNVITKHNHLKSAVDHKINLNYHNYNYSDIERNAKETDYVVYSSTEELARANYYQNYNYGPYVNYNEQMTNDRFQTNAGICSTQYYNFTNAEYTNFDNQTGNNSNVYNWSADAFLLNL